MILQADLYKCPPGCDKCGEPFLVLGKMRYFPNTSKGRAKANKLTISCDKRLISARVGNEKASSYTRHASNA